MPNDTSLLTFPCHFPIKVIGRNSPMLPSEVLMIINTQFPEITGNEMTTRLSCNHQYLAITLIVTAQNQQQLDNIYQQLSLSEKIIMAL